ncbi:MAG: hypothetical protein H6506_02315 [Calditrichaeota bacterium]|nr:hypothetical protein [Calditrichota bacterium]MCB9367048.1 hypothetical protein [Calditrichota bacterium]MCB9391468.1 hypothetical protein [Calditrichota bacterium]
MSQNSTVVTPLGDSKQLTRILFVGAVLLGCLFWFGDRSTGVVHFGVLAVQDGKEPLGRVELWPLTPGGELRLAFKPHHGANTENLEWWQLAERQDRPGYPRVDPQSGGSGLPGARGEDEDPAYYSERDFADPELSARIFADQGFWLLDRPTHDSGFNFESWLVRRTGPKSAVLLAGITWGIKLGANGQRVQRHPEPLRGVSRFDWEEALRISGFGSGWELSSQYQIHLP